MNAGGYDQDILEFVRRRAEGNGGPRLPTEASSVATPHVVRLSDVQPERVSWIWPSFVPAGKLTLLVGDPAAGKSTIALDIAARLSRGFSWPDGSGCAAIGNSLFCSLEDGLADTVRPRLDAAGAECAKVLSIADMGHMGEPLSLPDHVPALESIIREHEIALVILDPIKGFMSAGVNEWRDADVRRAIGPLLAMADRTGVAVLGILHLNKSAGAAAQYRVSGSVAWNAAARSVLVAARHPESSDGENRVLASLKSSLCAQPGSLAYRLVAADAAGAAAVVWDGPERLTAGQLLAAQSTSDEDRGAAQTARDFLVSALEAGPRPVREVNRAAEAEGISRRSLERARAGIGVRTSPRGFGGERLLSLPTSFAVSANPVECPPYPVVGDDCGLLAETDAPSGFDGPE